MNQTGQIIVATANLKEDTDFLFGVFAFIGLGMLGVGILLGMMIGLHWIFYLSGIFAGIRRKTVDAREVFEEHLNKSGRR